MGMLEILGIILLVMWLGGFAFNVGGSLIHLLLVAAAVMFIIRLMRPRTIL